MTTLDVAPTGKCHCGCGKDTRNGSFFLAGHDKKAESMLTKLKYGLDNSVAVRLAHEGYGPHGKNLLAEYEKLLARAAENRLGFYVFQSLAEMSGRGGVAEAVVFTGPPDEGWSANAALAGEPAPLNRSVLRVPLLATFVTQGYARCLSEAEKELVSSRYPDHPATWLTNS